MFKYIKFLLTAYALCLLSCTIKDEKRLSIAFSADSNKIIITDINEVGFYQIKNNIHTDSAYQKLVSVLQTPSENDSTSMEVEWPGKLSVVGDSLVFEPDHEFVKGKTYLVQTIINTEFASGKDIIHSDVGYTVKAQQKILKR